MSTVRRKRVSRAKKAPAKYPRTKATKLAPRATPVRKKTVAAGNFELLRAAHRGRMGEVLAGATADRLREIAQLVGLTHDTTRRSRHVPPPVLQAMNAADSSLLAQIDALEQFAQVRGADGPADLSAAVERAVAWCTHAAGRRDVHFEVDLGRRLPAVSLDAADLQEILFALLINAREAVQGRAPATIRISAVARDGIVTLTVEDDGPGLPAAMRKRLFGAFVTSHANGKHLGIGLAVARQLARDHGGELEYDGRGAGARFVLAMRAWRSPRGVAAGRRTLQ